MAYCPPGVPTSTFAPGTHQVVLTKFVPLTKADTLAKLSASAAYSATFKSLETAAEIDMLIKFNGSKSDYYAGLNIDRLHLAAELPEPTPGTPLDISALVVALDGRMLLLEVNDKGYAQNVLVPMGATGTDEAAPF